MIDAIMCYDSLYEGNLMRVVNSDGWRKPRSIYRSFFGSGVLTVGVIAIVCLIVVVVCHLFETPPPEVNALRYTYAYAGIVVVIVLLFNVIEPMAAMIKDDYNWHEFHGLMSVLKDIYPAFFARTQSHHARPVYWDANTKAWVEQQTANGR